MKKRTIDLLLTGIFARQTDLCSVGLFYADIDFCVQM